MFTVDYTNNAIADCPAQHKQSHVLYITEDCPHTFRALQQIGIDKRNIETYDTTGFDHPVDALRYGIVEIPIGKSHSNEVDVFGDRISSNMPF